MKMDMKNKLGRAMHLPLAFVFLGLIASGCMVADGLMGTNLSRRPPPKPVEARWQEAAGFSPQAVPKIALFAEDMSQHHWNSSAGIIRGMEDRFLVKLLEKGYQVPARSDLDKVMKEINFGQSGLTDTDAAKLGKMLNATATLVVTLTGVNVDSSDTGWSQNGVPQQRHTATCSISARLIHTETGNNLGTAVPFTLRNYIPSPNDPSSSVFVTAQLIANSLPSRVQPAMNPAVGAVTATPANK